MMTNTDTFSNPGGSATDRVKYSTPSYASSLEVFTKMVYTRLSETEKITWVTD